MRALAVYGLLLLISLSCKSQEKIVVRYIDHQYKGTKNKSFVDDELLFITNKDTLRMNMKIPFDKNNSKIINQGIFYNCHLREDREYTITLKKVCVDDISESSSNYYKTNAIVDNKDCSKFTEVEKHTEYQYAGNYGKYVDIDGVLYEVIGLTPSDDCSFQH